MATPEDVEKAAAELKRELTSLLNKHNFDTYADTPDFVLAEYLTDCLLAFGNSVKNRDRLGRGSL